ncbi:MAG: MarR family transcriptional regulator [Dehalobacterium sp.]
METINKKVNVAKLFSEINKTLKHNMRKSFEDMGITFPQGMVIATLIHSGEMKISELSRRINLSDSTVSGIIDRLEKQEFVVRSRSDADRRVVYVKATPKFKEMHHGFIKKAEERLAELLSAGTDEEIEKIMEGLTILNKILKDRNGLS